MATYVLGDIHGCYRTLETLLEQIPFRSKKDRLWLVGDLVNRGPRSRKTLRWAVKKHNELGDRFVAVLGNHDLHLLALAQGVRRSRRGDTLDKILADPKRAELLDWLAACPLLHVEKIKGHRFVLVHAGLAPGWTLSEAQKRAARLEKEIAKNGVVRVLGRRRHNEKVREMRRDLSAFTRIRCCDKAGRPVEWSGSPEEAPKGVVPWFEHPLFEPPDKTTLLFGHWAALGHRKGRHWVSLDSGAAWRGSLTALRLEDGAVFQTKARE